MIIIKTIGRVLELTSFHRQLSSDSLSLPNGTENIAD